MKDVVLFAVCRRVCQEPSICNDNIQTYEWSSGLVSFDKKKILSAAFLLKITIYSSKVQNTRRRPFLFLWVCLVDETA